MHLPIFTPQTFAVTFAKMFAVENLYLSNQISKP